MPRTGVFLRGPDGTKAYADDDGRVNFPSEWENEVVSIHDVCTRKEIARVALRRDATGQFRITVPTG